MQPTHPATIRPATINDIPIVLSLIRGLAEYENASHTLRVTEASLADLLFGPRPVADAALAMIDGIWVGLALYYETLSTFLGARGLFIEDLYVHPDFRMKGIGRALLMHAAGEAVRSGCAYMEWRALDWNEPAIEFYLSLGGRPLHEWTTYRLGREALRRLV